MTKLWDGEYLTSRTSTLYYSECPVSIKNYKACKDIRNYGYPHIKEKLIETRACTVCSKLIQTNG